MSPVSGTALLPSTTAIVRCGSHLLRLALPVELQRRGADDDRRVGVVGLERRERLDRLAEALLVGEERAADVERVADAGPLERLQRPAEARGDLGDRLAGRRARAADRLGRLGRLLAQVVERLAGAAADGDAVAGEEAVERVDDPRVERHDARRRARRRAGARTRCRSRGPTGPRASAARRRRRGGGRGAPAGPGRRPASSAARQRCAAPSSRAERSSSMASAAAGVSGTSSVPSSCSTAPSSSASGTVAGARVVSANQPRPSWRAVVMRPTQRRSTARSQMSTSVLVVSSGKRSTTSATWTPAQSSTGAYHSRRSQSKRRPGMRRTSATTCGSYGKASTTIGEPSASRRSSTLGRSSASCIHRPR